jgi:hypothetical protein
LTSGSFDTKFADIEAVAAHRGNNHEVLVARFHKPDRAPMFDLVGTLEFEAVSEDRRVPDALAPARARQSATRSTSRSCTRGSREQLPLRIRVHRVRLHLGGVLQQLVDDVHGLPHATVRRCSAR